MDSGILLFGLFFLFLLVNVPIVTAIGIPSLLFLWQFNLGIQVTAANIYANIAKFPLLAIPFFILAGFVMDRVGLSRGLVNLLNLVIGPVSRGPGLGGGGGLRAVRRHLGDRTGRHGGHRHDHDPRHGEARLPRGVRRRAGGGSRDDGCPDPTQRGLRGVRRHHRGVDPAAVRRRGRFPAC